MANDFGPTVTTLASTDVDATTKWPLSKSGAHNQILSSDVLSSVSNATVLPSGAVIANTLIVQQSGGTPGTTQVNISHTGAKTLIDSKVGGVDVTATGYSTLYTEVNVGLIIGFASAFNQLKFASGAAASQAVVSGINGELPGVIQFTDGTNTGKGWPQGRDRRITADQTNATATMANITDWVETLTAGDKYGFELTVKCNDSTAAEGIAFDFDGSTATATSFAASLQVTTGGTTVLGTVTSTALATDLTVTTITGESWVLIRGSIEVNGGGTFQPRFSQVSHTIGTATISKNSTMRVWRTTN